MKAPATIGAAEFKARCLAILDDLAPEGIVITKHGRPVARLLPTPLPPSAPIESLRDEIVVHGDTLSTGLRTGVDAET